MVPLKAKVTSSVLARKDPVFENFRLLLGEAFIAPYLLRSLYLQLVVCMQIIILGFLHTFFLEK